MEISARVPSRIARTLMILENQKKEGEKEEIIGRERFDMQHSRYHKYDSA